MESLIAIPEPKLVYKWESAENLLKLPRKSAIYLACDANDNVLYCGRTLAREGLRGRWQTHHLRAYPSFMQSFRKLYWWEIPIEITELEIGLIEKYQPKYNLEYSKKDLSLPFNEEVAF